MVPMRDGVKLLHHGSRPEGREGPLPIILIRTPYGIDGRAERTSSDYLKELADDGYVFALPGHSRAVQVGGEVRDDAARRATRTTRRPSTRRPTRSDTIDWLLKTVKNNNGRVGMLGVSYPGWLTAVAMLDPHPALKAVSPQASPADMFLGDDFHHNGAFRLSYGFEYVAMMETDKTNANFKFDKHDTYEWYLKLGALSNVNRKHFKGKLPTWNDFVAHPNYDAFWKKQSLEPRLTKVTVPTLNVAGLVRPGGFPRPAARSTNCWRSTTRRTRTSSSSARGTTAAGRGTRRQARPRVVRLGHRARTSARRCRRRSSPTTSRTRATRRAGGARCSRPARTSGRPTTRGRRRTRRRGSCTSTRTASSRSTRRPRPSTRVDEYVSDPANPVPYRPRPVRPTYPGPEWPVWMVQDQRFTHGRPDVLSYETEPLTEDVMVAGR